MGKRVDRNASRGLVKAEEGSVYGIVERSLGQNKSQVYCSDSVSRIATLRGSMVKRVWVKERDIVLCSLREGDRRYCDVELKYTDSEVKTLREGGYITDALLNQQDGLQAKIDFSQL